MTHTYKQEFVSIFMPYSRSLLVSSSDILFFFFLNEQFENTTVMLRKTPIEWLSLALVLPQKTRKLQAVEYHVIVISLMHIAVWTLKQLLLSSTVNTTLSSPFRKERKNTAVNRLCGCTQLQSVEP